MCIFHVKPKEYILLTSVVYTVFHKLFFFWQWGGLIAFTGNIYGRSELS